MVLIEVFTLCGCVVSYCRSIFVGLVIDVLLWVATVCCYVNSVVACILQVCVFVVAV